MAYKKYIIKNGKQYGPYTYHSKRVDGKVVSEYHGKGGPKINFKLNKNFILISIGILLIIVLVLFSINLFNKTLTGKVALNLETTYFENESIQGILRLSLKEGELLPSSSIVKIETITKNYKFPLRDLRNEKIAT